MDTGTTGLYAPGDVKTDILGKDNKIEDVDEKKLSSDGGLEANYVEVDEGEAKRILAKVDYRLVPVLSLLYLVAFVDRSNSKLHFFTLSRRKADQNIVGNAKIAGLTKDLNMHGLQYNTAVTLFFVPYTLLEIPSNIVLKMMRPSRWIAILMFSWGLVMTLVAFVRFFHQQRLIAKQTHGRSV